MQNSVHRDKLLSRQADQPGQDGSFINMQKNCLVGKTVCKRTSTCHGHTQVLILQRNKIKMSLQFHNSTMFIRFYQSGGPASPSMCGGQSSRLQALILQQSSTCIRRQTRLKTCQENGCQIYTVGQSYSSKPKVAKKTYWHETSQLENWTSKNLKIRASP